MVDINDLPPYVQETEPEIESTFTSKFTRFVGIGAVAFSGALIGLGVVDAIRGDLRPAIFETAVGIFEHVAGQFLIGYGVRMDIASIPDSNLES